MTPEERELLTQSIKLAEENNKILRGIRRGARWSSFFRIIYWLLIIGSVIVSYYYLKPYFDTIKEISSKITTLPNWLGGKQ